MLTINVSFMYSTIIKKRFCVVHYMLLLLLTGCFEDDDTQLIVAGDSIARAFNVSYFFPNHICRNFGVNGLGLDGLLGLHVEENCILIINIGGNNINSSMLDDQLQILIDKENKIISDCGAKTVFVLSVFPTDDRNKNIRIAKYNELLGDMLNNHSNVYYINCYNDFEDNGVLKPEYSRDGIHINDFGYSIIADRIHEKL